MSGKSRKIRAAIKKLLEPHLAAEGFQGRSPHFRRSERGVLHLLSVIYYKWGGGFVLEFAPHPIGPLETSWGTTVPEEELDIAYVSPSERARLVRTEGHVGLYRDFFRYDQFFDQKEECERLVATVIELFPQVNAWLRERKVGPNISPFVL